MAAGSVMVDVAIVLRAKKLLPRQRSGERNLWLLGSSAEFKNKYSPNYKRALNCLRSLNPIRAGKFWTQNEISYLY
jgi:hypothetical protein